MKKEYEASARTVEEAIEKGLQELGLSIGDVDVQVLEEGSKGLFGLFGSRMAKVRLTAKESEEDPLEDLITEEPRKRTETPAAPEAAPEPAPEKKPAEPAAEPVCEEVPQRPAPVRREAKKPAEKKKTQKQEPAAAAPVTEQTEEAAEAATVFRMEKPEIHMIPTEELDPESPAGIARAFLLEMTRLMGVEVTVDVGTDEEGHVYGYMQGDTLDRKSVV